MADVFISYARATREATVELTEKLDDEGYSVWTDRYLFADEQPFEQVIDAAVDGSKAVIVVWSTPALTSRWVKYEATRALRSAPPKLICTHTPDITGADLKGDFFGLHCPPVSDFPTILNTLLQKGVRPEGKTEADMPPEQVLERHARQEWRSGVNLSDDPEELRGYMRRYERARQMYDIAALRLKRVEARRATLSSGDAQVSTALAIFDSLAQSVDPEEQTFFVRKYAAAHPELALVVAERLRELSPDALIACVSSLSGSGEVFAAQIKAAERAIWLRDHGHDHAILRLDPGMHTAKINRLSVTADGRMLATASEDKTVKLWALPETAGNGARLVRTLRPPIGPGNEGKVYAVAMDPAGAWAAAGGWSKVDWVTIFDCTTGAVRARLGPLPNVVNDLEVSPDGRRLAAGLGGQNGVRVWDLAALPPAGAGDPLAGGYGGSVYGLAFAADGRLATTCYDGLVRLYGPDRALRAEQKAPGGERPFGIAFSPDGRALAVGYDDSARVDVLDADALAPLFSADTTGIAGGSLSSVAWRADGALAAGGRVASSGDRLHLWPDNGRGRRRALEGPDNTVMDLEPTGSGLAFAAGDPTFGLFGADGARTLVQGPETADLRGKRRDHFRCAADGRRLWFGLEVESATPVLFDLAARALGACPAPPGDLAAPDTARLAIDGWEAGTSPSLMGNPLPLKLYEMARSLAIAPDGQSFVLGTEWYVRRFAADGAHRWAIPVPGIAWGVHLAREGRLVIAACGDGTIRWHRAADGEELLALFIHLPQGPDGPREWILFTPKGYYDASSPAAESLIGWHVNNGDDEAADFYPVETFAKTFRRPDLIDKALDGV